MLALILVAIIFVVIVIIITHFNFKETLKTEYGIEKLPYEKKTYLMTNAEREFFFVLERAVQGRYYIIPQVELSKIVQVKKGEWHYKYKNKINLKSVDFVLFDKKYFTPQIVIELDELSHNTPERIKRDGFIDSLMKETGVRIEHIRTAKVYDFNEIIKII